MNNSVQAIHFVANDIMKFFKSDKFLNVNNKNNLFLKLLISLTLVLVSSTVLYLVYQMFTALFDLDYEQFIFINLIAYIVMFLIAAANKESNFTTVKAEEDIYMEDDESKNQDPDKTKEDK